MLQIRPAYLRSSKPILPRQGALYVAPGNSATGSLRMRISCFEQSQQVPHELGTSETEVRLEPIGGIVGDRDAARILHQAVTRISLP
jgi:hypothetical protein